MVFSALVQSLYSSSPVAHEVSSQCIRFPPISWSHVRHREKGEILCQTWISPPSASPSERDLFPCLSPASNPIANLPSRAEAQACGLSVCQAVNRLVMQDGLANYLYIIPQKTVREMLSFSQLPSSLLISRKCFYLQCPMKHGRTSLRSAEHLVICQEKDYLYLEDYL